MIQRLLYRSPAAAAAFHCRRNAPSASSRAFHRQKRYESSSSSKGSGHLQQPTKHAPSPAEPRPTVGGFYRQFSRPFAKVFVGALFTYQVAYYFWEKMRYDEIREEKIAEVQDLEEQLKSFKQHRVE